MKAVFSSLSIGSPEENHFFIRIQLSELCLSSKYIGIGYALSIFWLLFMCSYFRWLACNIFRTLKNLGFNIQGFG